jgi:hypothetical protein
VCVCGLYITDRVVASKLGRGPPDPHTHTHTQKCEEEEDEEEE